MPMKYRFNVLAELEEMGYSPTRLQKEKHLSRDAIKKLRLGEMVSSSNIERICVLLGIQPSDVLIVDGADRAAINRQRFFDWYNKTAVPEEQELLKRVDELEQKYFEDMSFRPGSLTENFISASTEDGELWYETLHDELEEFDTSAFRYHISALEDGTLGCFNYINLVMTISPKSIENDSVILHEMIHMHESVIDKLPRYYHDVLFFCLYKDLSKKICDLDERIEGHGNLFNENSIANRGGTHDILFLLKSYDLDLRIGYPLGTVFGYGYSEAE